MRISQLIYNLHPLTPQSTQAIYSTVSQLTEGLVNRNNDVTLFAAADSVTTAQLKSVIDSTANLGMDNELKKHYYHMLALECYKQASDFDIIHSHFSIISSFYSSLVKTPTVISLHSPISEKVKELLLKFKSNNYISFSLAQRKLLPELNWVGNIYHGVNTIDFSFNPFPEDYFLYLGRITEDKGVHLAIKAAKEANVPLVIAGISYPEESYWHTHIEPHVDGRMVKYVGKANYEYKIQLLQNAKALLFSSQVPETFGMVMIEAMSCGTPVIAWNKGSVPEVVQHRETGYVVDNFTSIVKAIKAIDKISREATRHRAQKLFSIDKMVSGYEKVYLRIIENFRKQKH